MASKRVVNTVAIVAVTLALIAFAFDAKTTIAATGLGVLGLPESSGGLITLLLLATLILLILRWRKKR